MAGRAMGVVVGTGTDTQVGMIARSLVEAESAKPPLIQRMEKFTKHVSIVVVVLCFIITFLLKNKGMESTEIFFFVVAMAVSAIPEGLPVAMTVVLSLATKRMSERNVIVRKLAAVESLGSCTVIASDKTGTLTLNQQTAKRIMLPDNTLFHVSGVGYNGIGKIENTDGGQLVDNRMIEDILRTSILANEGQLKMNSGNWEHVGDAMDVALLGLAIKARLHPEEYKESLELVGQIPYESENKFSASCYKKDKKVYYAAKGAVETILDFCTSSYYNGREMPLDRKKIEVQMHQLAAEGYRVLGFAGKVTDEGNAKECFGLGDLCGLQFYGLIGFIDPLRPEAKDAVKKCREAGIKVIMITGDHPVTSGAIARELQLSEADEEVVTGQMLKEAGDHHGKAFTDLVMSTHVFARVTPAQKLQIVDVLIRNGEFVAVTGDGVNDTPALRRANIGVAMGSGTDIAKDVGTMIVTDDNFSSIVAGVEEGRFAYANVRKVIILLMSTGAGSVVMVLGSIFANLPLPLQAVQFLWLNLVTNGIQDVALGFEAGEKGAMKKKPRSPNESIFDKSLITQTVLAGIIIGFVSLATWYWLLNYTEYTESSARNILFLLVVLFGNIHVFNCRSEDISAFRIPVRNNYILIFGVLISQGIHVASMHIPFMQKILHIEPVSFKYWIICVAIAFTLVIAMETYKMIKAKVAIQS
jgi:potassium/sodium efflux P-type ATPase